MTKCPTGTVYCMVVDACVIGDCGLFDQHEEEVEPTTCTRGQVRRHEPQLPSFAFPFLSLLLVPWSFAQSLLSPLYISSFVLQFLFGPVWFYGSVLAEISSCDIDLTTLCFIHN